MLWAVIGICVFVSVILILVLIKVLKMEQHQIKTIKVIRGFCLIDSTIKEFEEMGYKVVNVYQNNGYRHDYTIEFVKVR